MTREERFIDKLITLTNSKELVWSHVRGSFYTVNIETDRKATILVSPVNLFIHLPEEGSPIKVPMDRRYPEKLYMAITESKRMTPEVEAIIDNFLKDKR